MYVETYNGTLVNINMFNGLQIEPDPAEEGVMTVTANIPGLSLMVYRGSEAGCRRCLRGIKAALVEKREVYSYSDMLLDMDWFDLKENNSRYP